MVTLKYVEVAFIFSLIDLKIFQSHPVHVCIIDMQLFLVYMIYIWNDCLFHLNINHHSLT